MSKLRTVFFLLAVAAAVLIASALNLQLWRLNA